METVWLDCLVVNDSINKHTWINFHWKVPVKVSVTGTNCLGHFQFICGFLWRNCMCLTCGGYQVAFELYHSNKAIWRMIVCLQQISERRVWVFCFMIDRNEGGILFTDIDGPGRLFDQPYFSQALIRRYILHLVE